ncbi:MAG TPA: hypothetical protein PLI45_00925 [Candidatus Woesebacteria bacterium]|nr:hypothetical protein [Candidatus Woesebacteria bacterium]
MFGDKLELKERMVRTYLIQRLSKPVERNNPFSFGCGLKNGGLNDETMALLKDIFSFDYMGSAEFEFGAVPAALNFIHDQALNRMSMLPLVISGIHRGVYYICPKSYEKGVKAILDTLLEDEKNLRLNSYCGLKDHMNPEGNPRRNHQDNVGWLELNNGFFFFTDIEMFENTKRLFGIE